MSRPYLLRISVVAFILRKNNSKGPIGHHYTSFLFIPAGIMYISIRLISIFILNMAQP